MNLVFEEVADETEKSLPTSQSQILALAIDDKQKKAKPVEQTAHVHEYLVIYVHFLNRLFNRISGKKLTVLLQPTDFGGVKMAIFVDPNGIHVRLIELSPEHLVEVGKQHQVDNF